MSLLCDRVWPARLSSHDGPLLDRLYLPALSCAVRYDRSSGFFSPRGLALATRGLERLVANRGRMRLIVDCHLDEAAVAAIRRGESLRDSVAASLLRMPLVAEDPSQAEALELMAWLIARGHLDVKVAVPCTPDRQPLSGSELFHEKAGIIEDGAGNRLAFTGSANESGLGWAGHWESFDIHTSWAGSLPHLEEAEASFQRLWVDRAKGVIVLDVPAAVRAELLRFLPPEGDPKRLRALTDPVAPAPEPPEPATPAAPPEDPRALVWAYIRAAPTLADGGARVGEATSAVTPWPHQIRAFHRLYDAWPPRLLIADEVGLGKTIQAGMLLRQAWLSGRAKRILILAPKAVLGQWQVELREKFNLNWPIYDGQKLTWYPSPALFGAVERPVDRDAWHREPVVLASSHLMRRRDRAQALVSEAEPWDLVILDEAHHARRRGGGLGSDARPNHLLRLMRQLKSRTDGLVLLTATPMQVSPVEVWDLLDLLGLPPGWTEEAFVGFFDLAAQPSPSHADFSRMATLFRRMEDTFGLVPDNVVDRALTGFRPMQRLRILRALRSDADFDRRALEADHRRAAISLMRRNTPVRALISRHTRDLLHRYQDAGRLTTRIARRSVDDRSVELSDAERRVYEDVEDYISRTYNRFATGDGNRRAIGFVMTIYRKRLASSFHALACTLANRLTAVHDRGGLFAGEEDLPEDDETTMPVGEAPDAEEAAELERTALAFEEQGTIEALLAAVRRLPPDTKAAKLEAELRDLRARDYRQVMVFTQFTDTLDMLRDRLREAGFSVMCFSGRGGEIHDGRVWVRLGRDEIKRRFAERGAEILVCTDAAAEGLNFQFCGALVNYDMPWNPMKVEQRIGRIDRLGQRYDDICILNLHYADTVETDVYVALRERIGLFSKFVGRLQPILARLPQAIAEAALTGSEDRESLRARIERETDAANASSFDIDEITDEVLEEPPRPPPAYDLADLARVLADPRLLPPGCEARPSGPRDFAYLRPGLAAEVRVTTDPEHFDRHAESVELWAPGSPVFPDDASLITADAPSRQRFCDILAKDRNNQQVN